jgi:hypothetical protein
VLPQRSPLLFQRLRLSAANRLLILVQTQVAPHIVSGVVQTTNLLCMVLLQVPYLPLPPCLDASPAPFLLLAVQMLEHLIQLVHDRKAPSPHLISKKMFFFN